MAVTNHERVGKALDLLKAGLAPFVEREFKNLYKGQALAEAQKIMTSERLDANRPFAAWDAAVLLRLMWEAWNDVFRRTLGQAERTLVSELRDVRNRWAHQEPFSTDDAYRALDSAGRLLTAISAPQADEIEKMKMELLRVRFDEQVRSEKRRSAGTAIESQATGNLAPWLRCWPAPGSAWASCIAGSGGRKGRRNSPRPSTYCARWGWPLWVAQAEGLLQPDRIAAADGPSL